MIASVCMDRGRQVVSTSTNKVVCKAELSAGQAIVSQLALGNAYSTTPEGYVRFNIVPIPTGSRVQTSAWIETTMAFGQKRTMDTAGGRMARTATDFLVGIGGREDNPGPLIDTHQGPLIPSLPRLRSQLTSRSSYATHPDSGPPSPDAPSGRSDPPQSP